MEIYLIVDKEGNRVGEFESGVVYMDDGSYGEYCRAWLDDNGYTVKPIKE